MKEKMENKDISRLSHTTDLIRRLDSFVLDGWDNSGAPYCLGQEHHQAFLDAAQALRKLQEQAAVDKDFIQQYQREVQQQQTRIKELEDGSCRFNCRKVGKLHKIIDRIEKHSEKTVHAPKHRLVLYSDLQDLIRERKGEVKD